ncbi:hypothetical protein NQZ68_003551 [Dissostichus eleginoides]|nr:hypothetical protein NQZ68_003551 [Dissostichus eleginoides]
MFYLPFSPLISGVAGERRRLESEVNHLDREAQCVSLAVAAEAPSLSPGRQQKHTGVTESGYGTSDSTGVFCTGNVPLLRKERLFQCCFDVIGQRLQPETTLSYLCPSGRNTRD